MDRYEQEAWEEIRAWRQRRTTARLRRFVPERVRDGVGRAAQRGANTLRRVPGAKQFEHALRVAIEGAIRTVMEIGAATVARSRVVKRFQRADHQVDRIADIQALHLKVSDELFPRRKKLVYVGAGTAQGAVAGLAATVGDLGVLAGGTLSAPAGGVGAAPGAAHVIAAVTGDMVALLGEATRLVAETGAFYGYDPSEPGEAIFIAGVIGVATAGSESAKWYGYAELSQLTQKLARRATWASLKDHQLATVLAQVYKQLGFRLYKRNLQTALPVAGAAFGAATNAQLLWRVADEAYFSYRERRLRSKYPATEARDVAALLEITKLRQRRSHLDATSCHEAATARAAGGGRVWTPRARAESGEARSG